MIIVLLLSIGFLFIFVVVVPFLVAVIVRLKTAYKASSSYRLVVYSWNGDGTDGGDGGRAGYCRAAHLRAASLQPSIQSGRALSAVGYARAAPQAFYAAAATAAVHAAATDQEENIDDDHDGCHRIAADDERQQLL